jgi:hypothetical protein
MIGLVCLWLGFRLGQREGRERTRRARERMRYARIDERLCDLEDRVLGKGDPEDG